MPEKDISRVAIEVDPYSSRIILGGDSTQAGDRERMRKRIEEEAGKPYPSLYERDTPPDGKRTKWNGTR